MKQILRVNKTNFHMKGFALGLALKQRRKATRNSPIARVQKPNYAAVYKNISLRMIVKVAYEDHISAFI